MIEVIVVAWLALAVGFIVGAWWATRPRSEDEVERLSE